jgi:hypothetical protein
MRSTIQAATITAVVLTAISVLVMMMYERGLIFKSTPPMKDVNTDSRVADLLASTRQGVPVQTKSSSSPVSTPGSMWFGDASDPSKVPSWNAVEGTFDVPSV